MQCPAVHKIHCAKIMPAGVAGYRVVSQNFIQTCSFQIVVESLPESTRGAIPSESGYKDLFAIGMGILIPCPQPFFEKLPRGFQIERYQSLSSFSIQVYQSDVPLKIFMLKIANLTDTCASIEHE